MRRYGRRLTLEEGAPDPERTQPFRHRLRHRARVREKQGTFDGVEEEAPLADPLRRRVARHEQIQPTRDHQRFDGGIH